MTAPRSPPSSRCVSNGLQLPVSVDGSCREEEIPNSPLSKQSPKSRPATAARAVTFENFVRVKKTLHLNSYSDAEMDACWYSPDEYAQIRKDALTSASLSEEELINYAQDYCQRGVECFTAKGSNTRLKNKVRGRNAVLREQGLQWEEGVNRPDDIAKVYKLAASAAESAAIRNGRRDQVDASIIDTAI